MRQQQAQPKGAPPVVVVSALSKVTDALVAIAQLAEDGAAEKAAAEVQALLRAAPGGGDGGDQHEPRGAARPT